LDSYGITTLGGRTMKKVIALVGIALVTALAGAAVAWLKDPDNFEKASKQYKKLKRQASRKVMKLREEYTL
jgi:membrane protein required for beta-lactamase induction